MGALNRTYSFDERMVRPLQAGVDIILTPEHLGKAIAVVTAAVQTGRLSEAEVMQSVRRVLRAKAHLRLHEEAHADPARLRFLLAAARGDRIAEAVANKAVTQLNTVPELPLHAGQRTVLIQMTNYQNSESIEAAMDTLATALAGYEAAFQYDGDPSAAEVARMLAATAEADVVVLALYLRLRAGRGEAGLSQPQEQAVRQVLAHGTPVVLLTFGNPYAVTTFSEAHAFVVAYDQALASVHASARILLGLQAPHGRLPVTVDPYLFGAGIQGVD
jgi:beta-N-acetylhexosaminidase